MSNQNRSSVYNSVMCDIPGFLNPILIPFPKSKLPVCARCKKAFRARSLCREREGHVTLPWKSAYACIRIDDTCLSEDTTGRNFLLNEKSSYITFVPQLEDSAMLYETTQIIEDPDYRMCKKCKDVKNYSRDHCRCKQHHRELPWNVFHMKLTAISKTTTSFDDFHGIISSSTPTMETRNQNEVSDPVEADEMVHTDDVVDVNLPLEVPESKAFLLIIGSENCSLHVRTCLEFTWFI